MLTAFSDDEALLDSIMAGAAGYVLKQIRGSDLVGAVRIVASGRSLVDPRAASRAMARLRDETDRRHPLGGLTARERKVLELIGDGLTNRQIGERMSVAEKTVKNYVSTLFVKLGMQQRTQAAAYAARVFDGRTSGFRRHEDHQPEALNQRSKVNAQPAAGGASEPQFAPDGDLTMPGRLLSARSCISQACSRTCQAIRRAA